MIPFSNSAGLGLYVIAATLFSTVLYPPPFNFSFNALGYIFFGEFVTALVAPILFGNVNDFIVKKLSKRNNGIAEVRYLI